MFPKDFVEGESDRRDVINDILFSESPPSIGAVLKRVHRPDSSTRANVWSSNIVSWDAWSSGTLNKAYEIRHRENLNGWGSQGCHQRGMIENHIYEMVKKQNKVISEQRKQIQELIDILKTKKEEWVNIEETVTMV